MPALVRTDSFTGVRDVDFTLRRKFGKSNFRPGQKEIIQAALNGRDVYVQAATSFGKSLCFQLPAVCDRGITIVISPLLSLMMNQLTALRERKIVAHTLNSQISYEEKQAIYTDLASGHPHTKLLYVTPELCSYDGFRDKLQVVYQQRELARIVIDEAHCISEWGHDFRKDFKKLAWFRETFPDVPIMALTATANDHVRTDVLSTLGMATAQNPNPPNLSIFRTTAHRPNLHLEVRYTSDEADDRFDDFVNWIERVYKRRQAPERRAELMERNERVEGVSGIIYTITREECETLSAALRHAKIPARPFHAKMTTEMKEKTLGNWKDNVPGWEIIVATTAFGMGIDKENVRFVTHWRLPKSFEGYYQEAGRGGRDGNASYCFLYYAREDQERISNMVTRDLPKDNEVRTSKLASLNALVNYCEDTSGCRHAAICRYFGEEEVPACDYACDWCKDPEGTKRRMRDGLATFEFVSTQREMGTYDNYADE